MRYMTCLVAALLAAGCLEGSHNPPSPEPSQWKLFQVPDSSESVGAYFEMDLPRWWRSVDGPFLHIHVDTFGHAERLVLLPLLPYNDHLLALGWGLVWPTVEEKWNSGELEESKRHETNGTLREYTGRIWGQDEGRIGFLVLADQPSDLQFSVRSAQWRPGEEPPTEAMMPRSSTPLQFTAGSADFSSHGASILETTQISYGGSMAAAQKNASMPLHHSTFNWEFRADHASPFYMLNFGMRSQRPGTEIRVEWNLPDAHCQAHWNGIPEYPGPREDSRLFIGSGSESIQAHLEVAATRGSSLVVVLLTVVATSENLGPLLDSREITFEKPTAQAGCPEGDVPAVPSVAFNPLVAGIT